MSRIAANFAGNNPTAWDGTVVANDAVLKTKYYNQIIADAQAINCKLVDTNGDGTIDASDFTPTFTDRNGNGKTTDIGDTGQVQIGCRFQVITPGIANVVGGTVMVAAVSSFPVKTGMTAAGSGGGGGGSPPNAAFSGNGVITSVSAPATISGVAPFDVEFRDTSGGNPTSWLWTFTDPLGVTYVAAPGSAEPHLSDRRHLHRHDEGDEPLRLEHGNDDRDRARDFDRQLHGQPDEHRAGDDGHLHEHVDVRRDGLRLDIRGRRRDEHGAEPDPHLQHGGHVHGLAHGDLPGAHRPASRRPRPATSPSRSGTAWSRASTASSSTTQRASSTGRPTTSPVRSSAPPTPRTATSRSPRRASTAGSMAPCNSDITVDHP